MNCGVNPMSHEAEAECNEAKRTRGGLLAVACRLLPVALAAAIAACSSGSGGTDVTIGSGQDADPVTVDFPVFYVKRPVPDPDDEDFMENDVREPLRFEAGADLYVRDQASPSTPEVNITGTLTNGVGDIRDVDVNFDGSKVVFSMRIIEDPDEEPLPTWNIWEYDTVTKALRRVIASDTTAEEGHDIMPHYLPDGRIIFTSTRQRQSRAVLLDESKPPFAAQVEAGTDQAAFVLHVMDDDGANIQQLTFNQSHDLEPSVLNDGRIVFTHWEQARPGVSKMDIYTANQDGSNLRLLYGAFSHDTGTAENPSLPPSETNPPSTIQFLQPRAMPDGRVLAITRPFEGTSEGGDLVLIDVNNYVDCNQSVPRTTIGETLPCLSQARALPTDVRTIPGPSPGGRYRSAWPLFDGSNRLLVSWSQCRLVEDGRNVPCTSDRMERVEAADPLITEAPPLFGIYIYDFRDNTQKPIVVPEEGFIYTEVVAGAGRTPPPTPTEDTPASTSSPGELAALVEEGAGVLHIRSVYDIDGTDAAPGGLAAVSNPTTTSYANRTARFLRIEKVVSKPDDDTLEAANIDEGDFNQAAFGPRGRRHGMRDILGYAPIEPDGSVKVKVPANVAFGVSVVDRNGRRVTGPLGAVHWNWLQVVPGETLTCNGCHNPNSDPGFAHGRKGLAPALNTGSVGASPYPGANPSLPALNAGETMAEARGRAMCGGTCDLSVDIGYSDYWRQGFDPAAAPEIDMCYSAVANTAGVNSNIPRNPDDPTRMHHCENRLLTALPTTEGCRTNWNGLCRITINYEQHIHPMWGVERPDLTVAGLNVDANGNPWKCNTCHNPLDQAGAPQVAKGDLDLTDGPSEDQPLQFKSYRELLFNDTGETLNAMGQLEPECVETQVDPVTLVETCIRFRQVAAYMSANGANANTRFFRKMAGQDAGSGNTVDHSDFMSPSELRLLSEWLDIGAQYYNNPFAYPPED